MRKLFPLTFFITIFLSLTTNAQLQKGEKMLGATISFTTEKATMDGSDEEQKTTHVVVAPTIGFGLGKNWIVGAGLGVGYTKIKNDFFPSEDELTIFTVGVFARKFHEFIDKFGIYGQFNLTAGFGSGESAGGGETDVTTISAIVQPGFYFRPSKRFIMEATFGNIGYTHTKYENGTDSKSSRFAFSLTEGLGLGFKIVL